MKYTVNWVEKHLGVSRKVLRIYEEKGLFDKNELQNPSNKYREYDDYDLERIWKIRLLQNVGYSVQEIYEMTQNENYDYEGSISEKIIELERKKFEIEQLIWLAKTMKLTASIPYPDVMGSITINEFLKVVNEKWSIGSNPTLKTLQSAIEVELSGDKNGVRDLLSNNNDLMISDNDIIEAVLFDQLINDIIKVNEFDYKDPAVQSRILEVYNFFCEKVYSPEKASKMTPGIFGSNFTRYFTLGDFSKALYRKYGKVNCRFVAKAFAHFGGYARIEDTYV